MKITILCKRRPASMDLFNNPYGRFYNLAYQLSTMDNQVELILLSYKLNEHEKHQQGNLIIRSISLFPNVLGAFYLVYKQLKINNPDWIIAYSDIYYGLLAALAAKRFNKKYLIDAYDNYEAYLAYMKPLHWLWRKTLKHADLVTCAGASLQTIFRKHRQTGVIKILPMTADSQFFEQPRESCRKKLELPLDKKLVGYHGSISHTRDIKVIFSAAKQIAAENQYNIKFVLTGRKDNDIDIPNNILYLGYLPAQQMPLFVNSLDVLVVTNKLSKFGNYSHPTKLYEALACHIPVVVSRTQSTEWIMQSHPELLVDTENVTALANKIKSLVDIDRIVYKALPSWRDIAYQLAALMKSVPS